MSSFPAALPHGAIEEVFDDVFMVRGSFDMRPLMRIARNMIIVREGSELTLVNCVRLDERGEAQLRELGEPKHVVRIGAFHGSDVPYYREALGLTYWTQEGQRGPDPDETLTESHLPIDAQLFEFQGSRFPEGILRLNVGEGLLVSCDSIQNMVELEGNLLAKVASKLLGFQHPCHIGKLWRDGMWRGDEALKSEVQRLLELRFDSLLSAHGQPNRGSARADLEATLTRLFGPS